MDFTCQLISILLMLLHISVLESQIKHSSFTPYENSVNLWAESIRIKKMENCEAKQIIFYSRHASRYPGKKSIEIINQLLPKLKKEILKNSGKFKNVFRFWHSQYNDSLHHLLSKTGEQEMLKLGNRYSKIFPSLLGPPFGKDDQEYRYSMKQRTELSAAMFAKGALGNEEFKNFESVPPKEIDPLLRFYKSCHKWKKEVDKSVKGHHEEKKFLKSVAYENTIRRISEKIYSSKRQLLSHDEVKAIFTACVFDYMINDNRTSPWCSVLSSEDLEVFEYWNDVEHFWTDGHPFPLTYEQACRPIQDVVSNFKKAMSGKDYKKALLRFSHLGLILKIQARLGLFKDDFNLTSDLFNSLKPHDRVKVQSRLYSMNKIGPMSSNIAFVLYKCARKWTVKTYIQEHEVILGGCKSSECNINRFMSTYDTIATNCDVDKICAL